MAGTSRRFGAGIGIGIGVMVGDTNPDVRSTLEHQWWVKEGKPIASLHTLRVSHTMGLPLCFLSVPNPQCLLKPTEIDVGWPTSLVGGERPGGSKFGCVGTEKGRKRLENV